MAVMNERCFDMAVDFITRNRQYMVNGVFYNDEDGACYFETDGSYYVSTGATKIVLIDEDDNEDIVKIPFNGFHESSEDCVHTDECDEFSKYLSDTRWTMKMNGYLMEEGLDTLRYPETPCDGCNDEEYDGKDVEFENANSFAAAEDEDFMGNDYCEIEAFLGKKATELGIDNIFVPTYFLGMKDGIPFYTQKKINTENHATPKPESRKTFSKIYGGANGIIGEVCGGLILEEYGEEVLKKVIQFVKAYEICDLHAGNWCTDNGIKIIDYSGYRDN